MSRSESKITLGLYSPSQTVLHLFEEQLQDMAGLYFKLFADEAAFVSSLGNKEYQAYLWDKGPPSFCLSWHTFPLGQEKKEVILKPFRLSILREKVSSLEGENLLKLGPYVFNEKQRLLTDDTGKLIPLREKEAALLLFLLKTPQKKADRQTLLQQVWGYSQATETHTLETHVYHLRQKIEKDPARPQILINEEAGYRLGG